MTELNTTAIRKLIRALSGTDPWPQNFLWDFSLFYSELNPLDEADLSCGCAVGLAYELNMIPEPVEEHFSEVFGLTIEQFDQTCTEIGFNMDRENVTPEMVSRKFEELLLTTVKRKTDPRAAGDNATAQNQE